MAGSISTAGVDRLAALDSYGILDTPAEQDFDDIVHLASEICDTPVALVSLVAADRQWFKARVGFDACETPIEQSVCAHALAEPGLLVIPDLSQDPRTAANTLVTQAPHIRFYAGARLETPDGHVLGTLCVIDDKPRPEGLTPAQATNLERLARQVVSRLELRKALAARDAGAQREQAADDRSSRALAALAVSEDRYRALFDAIDDGFCIIEFFDGPHGPLSDYTHIAANPGYERQTGIKGIVGQTLRQLAPGQADGWVALYGSVLRTGEPVRFERWFEEAGCHIEVSASRVEPASLKQVSVLFRNIEQRRRAEDNMRTSEERYRLVTRATNDAIWDWDLVQDHVLWNDALATAYGYGPADVVPNGAWWLDKIHPEDREQVENDIRGTIAGAGHDWSHEYRFRRRDGTYADVLDRGYMVRGAGGEPVRMIGAMLDLSERKRDERRLRDMNALLEGRVEARTRERDSAWRNSQDLLVVGDPRGTITAVNAAWMLHLGYGEAELVGANFVDLIHPDDREALIEAFVHISMQPLVAPHECRMRHRDGSWRWFSWTAAFEEGFIYAAGRNVTAEKEQAEALRRTEEQLRQSQKMEAVGQLTGGIAHDFNNLLAGISGSLELMQTRMTQGRIGELERYMIAAQGATKRAAALTHRLLAFSRRQTLDPRATDVNRLVADMEELVRRTVGPAIAVEVVAAGGLWTTLVDPPQLENALLNLCINARDAMPDGGSLTIETANRWLDQRAAGDRDLPAGQYISLCVSDTGTGMTPDVIAKAFDPFFTTKPIGQGTGLGLSMIYGFARQSGGQVRIYSEPGEGSMVCIYLPRLVGEAQHEPLPDFAHAPRAQDGETVLVVDDEPTVRMLVTEILQELGYAAIEAADAMSGLKVLQSEVRVDLLVTDVGLPGGMNGRQMADAARITRPNLKVLFITGYAENAAVGNGHLGPGMEVLTKPFAMEALASRIKEMITRPPGAYRP